MTPDGRDLSLDVAVIAMAGRFPGADSVAALWDNLVEGRECILPFTEAEYLDAGGDPAAIADPEYVRVEAAVDGVDRFDAAFFGYRRSEAETIDPQQRLFLECAYHALEQAGYLAGHGASIGVYGGAGQSRYYYNNILPSLGGRSDPIGQALPYINNAPSAFATRVSYELGLTGPSMSVQTACSTSLVAVHLAYQDLVGYQCDLALAGGASLSPSVKRGYQYIADGPFSPDGHCRAFDAGAAGTVPGDGVAVVVLKRLADAIADGDQVLAVVKGTAINNDGRRKTGFATPSPVGQAEAIIAAHIAAGVSADTIGFVEAHGTGTPVGDPLEVEALTRAFARTTSRTGFCALGSVKSNIGHLDAAAGVAGFIKAVLALRSGTIPATVHFATPNPRIDFERSPFYVNGTTRPWPSGNRPRRAGVSAFGVGGTNAHVVLEEAPPATPAAPADPCSVLVVSARTATALRRSALDLADSLATTPELSLSDVGFTLQVGRRHMPYRYAVVGADPAEVADQLRTVANNSPEPADDPAVVFMFPGVGAHYDGMGRQLYEAEPVFRDEIGTCARIVRTLTGADIRTVLHADPAAASEGDHTHHFDRAMADGALVLSAALLATEYALARWLTGSGVRPAAMMGHSLGEYTAACLAGTLRLEDALRLVIERERLLLREGGATISVALGEADLTPYLTGRVSVAAVNGPSQCAVSGPTEDLTALAERLTGAGVRFHQLRIPVAAHSALLEPALGDFAALLGSIPFNKPETPYLSNVTGDWITPDQATDPAYWVRHTRATVRFAAGLDRVATRFAAPPVLVEVGPNGGLGKLAVRQLGPGTVAVPTLRHAYAEQPDQRALLGVLGQLWQRGVRVDWAGRHTGRGRRRVPLPAYPFERRSFWVEAPPLSTVAPVRPTRGADAEDATAAPPVVVPAGGEGVRARPPLSTPYLAPRTPLERELAGLWQEALDTVDIGVHDNFFDLGGESLTVLRLVSTVRSAFGVNLSARQLFLTNRLTIAGFAAEIDERRSNPKSSPEHEESKSSA